MQLHDLYLSGLSVERLHGIDGPGRADIEVGFGEPMLTNGRLSLLSGVRVTLIRDVDDEAIAEIRSDYVAVMTRDEGDWGDSWEEEVDRDELARFAFIQLYSRHRERIMEATLRMGLPIFKLSLNPPELSEADLTDSPKALRSGPDNGESVAD